MTTCADCNRETKPQDCAHYVDGQSMRRVCLSCYRIKKVEERLVKVENALAQTEASDATD